MLLYANDGSQFQDCEIEVKHQNKTWYRKKKHASWFKNLICFYFYILKEIITILSLIRKDFTETKQCGM